MVQERTAQISLNNKEKGMLLHGPDLPLSHPFDVFPSTQFIFKYGSRGMNYFR
jgi:hypothetical protein